MVPQLRVSSYLREAKQILVTAPDVFTVDVEGEKAPCCGGLRERRLIQHRTLHTRITQFSLITAQHYIILNIVLPNYINHYHTLTVHDIITTATPNNR